VNASIAFYRKLGMEIPDGAVWHTSSGARHANAAARSADRHLDSATFARV